MELQITKSAVIRDIVSTHVTQYGSDTLVTLPKHINLCNGPEGTTSSKIALAGIYTLCRESVIDMMTTVKVFAPKCGKNKRPLVRVQSILWDWLQR